jgi:hypothetical protein
MNIFARKSNSEPSFFDRCDAAVRNGAIAMSALSDLAEYTQNNRLSADEDRAWKILSDALDDGSVIMTGLSGGSRRR